MLSPRSTGTDGKGGVNKYRRIEYIIYIDRYRYIKSSISVWAVCFYFFVTLEERRGAHLLDEICIS